MECLDKVPVPHDAASQRPPAPKKAKDDRPHGVQRKQSLAAPADSRAPEKAEFKRVSSGTTRRQSMLRRVECTAQRI